MKRAAGALAVAMVVFICLARSFHDAYVFPADGLLELRATPRSQQVIRVSGIPLTSGGKIVKITRTRYGNEVLVRVYGAAITRDDSRMCCSNRFSVLVPVDPTVHAIRVGESDRWLTVGTLFGVPLRMPRRPADSSRVVWRADSAHG